MNTYRHHLIIQTLALLPFRMLICTAAYAAHRQQGPCPPVWRPFKLYQYRRRQQALRWLLDAVARSLQGHVSVGIYLGDPLPNMPDMSGDDYRATLLHVRTAYLQDLLNHTTEDSPTLKFEDYLPEYLPDNLPSKPTGPGLQTQPWAVSKVRP